MVLSVSAALLLGTLVVLLWRHAGLRPWHAAVCILFGFLLASTTLAPHIAAAVRYVARLPSGINL